MAESDFQRVVREIAFAYLDAYRRTKARGNELLAEMDSDSFRHYLSEIAPDTARDVESRTLEERQQKLEEAATAVGVAHAILEALRKLT
jgi:hypothetical protein